jgi:hypothetical protein
MKSDFLLNIHNGLRENLLTENILNGFARKKNE